MQHFADKNQHVDDHGDFMRTVKATLKNMEHGRSPSWMVRKNTLHILIVYCQCFRWLSRIFFLTGARQIMTGCLHRPARHHARKMYLPFASPGFLPL